MNYCSISLDEIKAKVEKRKPTYQLNEELFAHNVKEISNDFGETLVRVDGDIPVDLDIENGQRFLFISYDQSRYSHGLHKYPAKFFPELPRWLIKRYSNVGDLILDPFCGSGTVNVEALLHKRHSIGVDIDPFARFLSKVKTTPLDKFELDNAADTLLKKILEFKPALVEESDLPDFSYRDNWFNKEILFELAYIRKIINALDISLDLKDFFKICFSSIIRAVSNADDNCTRTVIRKKLNKQIYPSMALTKFVEKTLTNAYKMKEFSKAYDRRYFVDLKEVYDARKLSHLKRQIDLAVTSPPYVNAVDYPRTHQLEIYWLDIIQGSLAPLKKTHIGTETVSVKDYQHLHKIGIKAADEIMSKIFTVDSRRAFIAYKYLKDMEINLKEVYNVLKAGGKYIIVVGNNKIRGETFETWKYLIELAEKIGFHIDCYFGSEIIKHFIKVVREERIDTDWIIILEK